MSDDPENLTLALLRQLDRKMDTLGAELRAEIAETKDELRAQINSLRADVASDIHTLEKRLGDQIVGLRRAVVETHSSAVGHGVLLSEFEERLSRVERHIGLPDPH